MKSLIIILIACCISIASFAQKLEVYKGKYVTLYELNDKAGNFWLSGMPDWTPSSWKDSIKQNFAILDTPVSSIKVRHAKDLRLSLFNKIEPKYRVNLDTYFCDSIYVTGHISNIWLHADSNTNTIETYFVNANRFEYQGDARKLKFVESEIDSLILLTGNKSKVLISDAKINYGKLSSPQLLVLHNVSTVPGRKIEFYKIFSNDTTITKVLISDCDFDSFAFPLDHCSFIVNEKFQTYQSSIILYQKILNKLKDAGLTESYESVDKAFQEFKMKHNGDYIMNFISKYWWGYGYDKKRVFENGFMLFIIFFLLNAIFFDTLCKVYFPDKLLLYNKTLLKKYGNRNVKGFYYYRFFRLSIIFLYTSYLFWGLKLDIEKISVKSWFGIFIVILQYTIGIICLAYMANYVLSK